MSDEGHILLVADRRQTEALSPHFGGDVTSVGDPFDALEAMSRRAWSAVVLASDGDDDFAGLCRAARRLQRKARLYAVCPPSREADVRGLVGPMLNDYFIDPPSAADVALIRGAGRRQTVTEPASASQTVLNSVDFSALLAAANSISSLESCVASMVRQRLGHDVAWFGSEDLPANALPLLIAPGESSRVLASCGAVDMNYTALAAFLAEMQECLPALLETARQTESLHRLAITDHLTGAYNRRYFYHMTNRILARAAQTGSRVTMLLFDVDDFKRYNDTYGHAAGDEVLRETTALIKKVCRAHDVVARIGGDEFAVLFWDAGQPRVPDSEPLAAAGELVSRFRRLLARHQFPSLGPDAVGSLTISGGLAMFPRDGQDVRQLLRACDKGLHEAKASGKNRIHLIGTKPKS